MQAFDLVEFSFFIHPYFSHLKNILSNLLYEGQILDCNNTDLFTMNLFWFHLGLRTFLAHLLIKHLSSFEKRSLLLKPLISQC